MEKMAWLRGPATHRMRSSSLFGLSCFVLPFHSTSSKIQHLPQINPFGPLVRLTLSWPAAAKGTHLCQADFSASMTRGNSFLFDGLYSGKFPVYVWLGARST